MTVEEYLEFEKAAPERHEYTAGDVYPMPHVSLRHNRIVGNVLRRLHASAKGSLCHVYFSELKLRAANDVIYYPDIMVVCEDNPDMDAEIVRDPCLVVEVTSPGTARVDRVEKLRAYRSIVSLKSYLIVEQALRRVDRHWRDSNGDWQHATIVEDTIPIPCPETTLTLDEIYEGLAPLTVRELEAIGYAL
jgi:Uma2 family endonuclease